MKNRAVSMGGWPSVRRGCGKLTSVVVMAASGVILCGCSGGGISNPLPSINGALPHWFASTRPAATPTEAQAAVKRLDDDCPSVDVRTGAGTLAVSAKSKEPSALDLKYQLSFRDFARECRVEGSIVRMRVGVRGRAIVGPAGAPPQVSIPLRYAVVREGVQPKTIVTKFRRIPLQIPAGLTNVEFTDIEDDLSFPMPSLAELQSYVVYVGFDEHGDVRPTSKAGKGRKSKAAKKKTTPNLR